MKQPYKMRLQKTVEASRELTEGPTKSNTVCSKKLKDICRYGSYVASVWLAYNSVNNGYC